MKKKIKDLTCEDIELCENCPLYCVQCHNTNSLQTFGDIAKTFLDKLEQEIEVEDDE